ncbi:MAG: hypothetical protein J6386_10435 [Candidatus Synoicihabitans palmerolidicus]|nr:hypothetical protein [Candidatus Synoicihabitans palmerolidicus]
MIEPTVVLSPQQARKLDIAHSQIQLHHQSRRLSGYGGDVGWKRVRQ